MLESLPMRPPMISLLEQPTTKISPVSRCAACSSSSAACRACADAYRDLAQRTGRRSMLLRAALLRLGLPVYQAFLKHKA